MFDPATWFMLIAGGAVAYGLWTTARPTWPIKIVVSPAGLDSHRGLPRRCVAQVANFFERDVHLASRVVIFAHRQRNGRLRTQFRGRIDAGTRQQIRNFLTIEL